MSWTSLRGKSSSGSSVLVVIISGKRPGTMGNCADMTWLSWLLIALGRAE